MHSDGPWKPDRPGQVDNEDASSSRISTWTYLLSYLPWARLQPSTILEKKTSAPVKDNYETGNSSGNDYDDLHGDGVMVESQSQLSNLSKNVSRLNSIIASQRTEATMLRAQESYELQKMRDKLRFVDESMKSVSLSSPPRENAQESNTITPADMLQLIEDWKELLNGWDQFQALKSLLSSKQSQVDRVETKFVTAVNLLLRELQGDHAFSDTALEDLSATEASSDGSEGVPEAARLFFESSGDLVALEEHVMELKRDYQDAKIQRDLLRDQEREPSTPDEEFDARFEANRSHLESQLAETRAKIDHLRLQCDAEGINLDTYGAPADDGTLNADSLTPNNNDADPLMATRLSEDHKEMMDNVEGNLRVDYWLSGHGDDADSGIHGSSN